MQLDLSKLIADKPIAVHFSSFEQASAFFDEMKRQYPDVVGSWPKPFYEEHYARDGGVCYCPYFNRLDDGYARMTHSSRTIYERDRGYKILEFEDLLCNIPELETEEVDLPLSYLFC